MRSARLKLRIGLVLLMVFLFTTTVADTYPHTPLTIEGVTVVKAEEALDLMKEGVPIMDVRVAHEYVMERIKGAISLPYKEKSLKRIDYDPVSDRFDLSKLPEDKSASFIFYCNGAECWKSYKACKAAVKAGYTNVYWMRGGIPEWKAKGLPVE